MSWWTPANQTYAFNYLVGAGLSPYGAAALVSRWANVEATNGPSSRGGFLNHAWGIAQWLGPRLPPIDGNPSFNDQLAYVIQELQRPESAASGRAFQILQTAQDAYSAAIGASLYERASGFNSSTGVDNFTQRTANGIPAVLAAVGAASTSADYGDAAGINTISGDDYSSSSPIFFENSSSDINKVAIIIAIAIALRWLL